MTNPADDDFAKYLQSDDAASAEPWQLRTLQSLRLHAPERVTQRTYEMVRAAIAADVAEHAADPVRAREPGEVQPGRDLTGS